MSLAKTVPLPNIFDFKLILINYDQGNQVWPCPLHIHSCENKLNQAQVTLIHVIKTNQTLLNFIQDDEALFTFFQGQWGHAPFSILLDKVCFWLHLTNTIEMKSK